MSLSRLHHCGAMVPARVSPRVWTSFVRLRARAAAVRASPGCGRRLAPTRPFAAAAPPSAELENSMGVDDGSYTVVEYTVGEVVKSFDEYRSHIVLEVEKIEACPCRSHKRELRDDVASFHLGTMIKRSRQSTEGK